MALGEAAGRAQRDQIAEHTADLDGGKLIAVADQDKARLRGEGARQLLHQREADHRRLVDDDGGVGQGAVLVVAKLAAAQPDGTAGEAKQSVQGGRRRRVGGVAQDFGDAVGCLSGGRGDGDPVGLDARRQPGADDTADEGGLAGSRPPRDDREGAPARRVDRRHLLLRPTLSGSGGIRLRGRRVGSGQPRLERISEALFQTQVALVIEELTVDDERPVVARLADERRKRRKREPRIGQTHRRGAIVLAGAEAREPGADRRQIQPRGAARARFQGGEHDQREGPPLLSGQVGPAAGLDRQVDGCLVHLGAARDQIARPDGRPGARVGRGGHARSPPSSAAARSRCQSVISSNVGRRLRIASFEWASPRTNT